MKKLLVLVSLILTSWGGVVHAAHTSQYWICSTPSLKAVYQYPTGSYWVAQTTQYPAYYTAHNAYYLGKYGC